MCSACATARLTAQCVSIRRAATAALTSEPSLPSSAIAANASTALHRASGNSSRSNATCNSIMCGRAASSPSRPSAAAAARRTVCKPCPSCPATTEGTVTLLMPPLGRSPVEDPPSPANASTAALRTAAASSAKRWAKASAAVAPQPAPPLRPRSASSWTAERRTSSDGSSNTAIAQLTAATWSSRVAPKRRKTSLAARRASASWSVRSGSMYGLSVCSTPAAAAASAALPPAAAAPAAWRWISSSACCAAERMATSLCLSRSAASAPALAAASGRQPVLFCDPVLGKVPRARPASRRTSGSESSNNSARRWAEPRAPILPNARAHVCRSNECLSWAQAATASARTAASAPMWPMALAAAMRTCHSWSPNLAATTAMCCAASDCGWLQRPSSAATRWFADVDANSASSPVGGAFSPTNDALPAIEVVGWVAFRCGSDVLPIAEPVADDVLPLPCSIGSDGLSAAAMSAGCSVLAAPAPSFPLESKPPPPLAPLLSPLRDGCPVVMVGPGEVGPSAWCGA
mmetsp:Transcript_74677/g.188785  ORF Transcript_74677/g.188785 Transcript_74677/m.188785 type:complete len:519 (-) Transcript_74677:949-2505(-)